MSLARQAVILAGGKGTRLQERLAGRPKPLVDVDGIPLLRRQIDALRAARFTDLLILVNHAADQIADFLRDPAFDGLRVTLIDDGDPRGTAGALLHAFDHLDDRFLVVYGDTLFDVDLDAFWRSHEQAGTAGSVFLHPNDHPFDSDLVEIDEANRVVAFHAPPHPAEGCLPNLVNAALYVLEREAIAFWRDAPTPSDIARDLFPAMLRRDARLSGYVSFEYIKDIGTPKRLDKAVAQLRSGMVARARRDHPQRAVFLDRDGTINLPAGHLALAGQMALLPGAAHAIRQLTENEYRTVVVTNQPVVARGEASFAELRRIHGRMETLLGADGAFVDRIEFCPHHPDSGYPGEVRALKIDCDCRKPGIAMIERARDAMNIDLRESWMVGDSTGDMLAASRAGLRSILVETGEAGRDNRYPVRPDFTAPDLAAAADFITRIHPALDAALAPLAEGIAPGSLVLIGGLAKQGKSTLASMLRHRLQRGGVAAEVVSLDGYLRDLADREPGVEGRFDLDAVLADLAGWLGGMEGGVVDIPLYDRFRRTRYPAPQSMLLDRQTVVILEGVPALLLRPVTPRPVLRLFLDSPEGDRRDRVVADLVRRGAEAGEAAATYAARQLDEAPLIERSAALATLRLSPMTLATETALPGIA
jgi:histidinol-phosphate phosphatase family protein